MKRPGMATGPLHQNCVGRCLANPVYAAVRRLVKTGQMRGRGNAIQQHWYDKRIFFAGR
jgi:hypothetical protein